jgi:predicted nucleic acid-binding protein
LIAIDTNILAYAEQKEDAQGRHEQAIVLMEKLTTGTHCIPIQVFAEFMNACRKKKLLSMEQSARKIHLYGNVFETPYTLQDDLIAAAELLTRFKLQYFDALIIAVSNRAGATILLSEDMQDGLEVDGLRILNPFVAENDGVLADYFAVQA